MSIERDLENADYEARGYCLECERLRTEIDTVAGRSDRWQEVWLQKCNENDRLLVQNAELLAALREMLSLLDRGHYPTREFGRAKDAARAAIARAEGSK